MKATFNPFADEADEADVPEGLFIVELLCTADHKVYRPPLWWEKEQKARELVGGFLRDDLYSGAWATPEGFEVVRRPPMVIAVSAGSAYEVAHYAAEKAPAFFGFPPEHMARYDRHGDGAFRCLRCGKRYEVLGPFASHLRRRCGDVGGSIHVGGWAFGRRNGDSPKAWARIRAASAGKGVANG